MRDSKGNECDIWVLVDHDGDRTLFQLVEVGSGDEVVRLAEWIVAATGHDLLYARVDLVPADDGSWQVGELEATEPLLYLDRDPDAAKRLAEAIAAPLRTDRFDGLWATVVVDAHGVALGLSWSNLESLREAVERGPRAIPAVLQLARDLLSLLEYAHAQRIVIRRRHKAHRR